MNNHNLSHINLNLSDYSIDDLLSLFRLPNVDMIIPEQMKSARKIVMSVHPDKSGLDKSYFQFFAKAYEKLSNVVDYYNRTSQCPSSYLEKHRKFDVEMDSKTDFAVSLQQAKIITEDGHIGKNWNKWKKEFDEWFEKNSELTTDNEGYEDFLRSTKDLLPEGATKAEAEAFMERRRAGLRALVVKESVDGIDSWNSFGRKQSSGVGSTYGEDIKKAYTENVIPVTKEDFENRRKYSSMDEYKRARHNDESYIDYDKGKEQYYKQRKQQDQHELANYLQQLNITEKKHNEMKKFQSNFLRLMG